MTLNLMSIPEGWAPTSFEAVCHLRDSRRIPVNKAERAQRIAGKPIGDLYPYYGATGQVGLIDGFIFEGEHILLGEDGAPFLDPLRDKAYLVNGKFWVNNHAHILSSIISNKYVLHYLNQIDYSAHVTGTTRLKLTQGALRRIPIQVAPTGEQHRIVAKIEELFSELDKGVESLVKAREQLKVYRQTVLKHAFEGKLTAQWREENKDQLENPEQLLANIKQARKARYGQHLQEWSAAVDEWEEGGKLGKKPPRPKKPRSVADVSDVMRAKLPKLPEGWLWARLGNISEVAGGLTKNQKRNDLPIRMKYLRVANVYSDRIVARDVYEMGVTDAENQRVALRPGDLLIVEGNGSIDQIGRVAMWDGRLPLCGHQNHLIRVRLSPEFSPRFFLHFLLSPLGRELVVREASSTSGLHTLSISKVSALVVPVMSSAEEAEILAQLEARLLQIDKSLEKVDEELLKSQMLRQSILKKAFSGQLVAQDPKDEPALALLARIKAEKAAQSHTAKIRKKRRRAKATA